MSCLAVLCLIPLSQGISLTLELGKPLVSFPPTALVLWACVQPLSASLCEFWGSERGSP